jgi:hypothetical protein
MDGKKIFGVILTDQGWDELGEAISPYMSKGSIGRYIYCDEVQVGGPYFVMVTSCSNPDKSSFLAEVCIPHHYVKMYVSANEKSQIGFANG